MQFRQKIDTFLNYFPQWYNGDERFKYLQLAHTSHSKNGVYGQILLYVNDTGCIFQVKVDGHVLELKLRKALQIPAHMKNAALSVPKSKVHALVDYIMKKSDTTHLLGHIVTNDHTFTTTFVERETVATSA